MATVGYGDVHAEGQVARALVCVLIVFNVVVVASLVRAYTTRGPSAATDGYCRAAVRRIVLSRYRWTLERWRHSLDRQLARQRPVVVLDLAEPGDDVPLRSASSTPRG